MDYEADIESDLHRFHRLWVDFEAELFPPISVARLIQTIERLVAYQGVLTIRAQHEYETQTPGHAHSTPDRQVIGSSAAELMANPATAGLFEIVKVPPQ